MRDVTNRRTIVGLSGLTGETVAATGAMFIGAVIGYATEWTSEMLD